MNFNQLFATETATQTTSKRNLVGTAQLTSTCDAIAKQVMNAIEDNIELYGPSVVPSQSDSNVLDKLITDLYNLQLVETDFLQELDADVLESMLKSQQSKRSRAKSKEMTSDNYLSMASAAAAEMLIRQVLGREKSFVGSRRAAGSLEYTPEELEAFKEDQDGLRREIRNIQSKKSIMKARDDFSEENDRWLALCEVEAMLKGMRTAITGPKTIIVDTTKEKLLAALNGRGVDELKAAEVKELLKSLLEETAA